jgi:hypothetical protein
LRWPRDTLCPQKLALTSPTCGDRSVSIVRLRTKNTEFVFLFLFVTCILTFGRTQWPCGLRRELSSLARTLAWMSVLCAFILCLCCSIRR